MKERYEDRIARYESVSHIYQELLDVGLDPELMIEDSLIQSINECGEK